MHYETIGACFLFSTIGAFVSEPIGGSGLAVLTFSGLWPLVEYIEHKMLHQAKINNHLKHHQNPDNKAYIRVNLRNTMPYHFGTVGFLWLISSFNMACLYSSTIVFWYCIYELIHEYGHHCDVTGNLSLHAGPMVLHSLEWHKEHHRNPRKNFAVSTPFWDIVFGTTTKSALKYLNHWSMLFLPIPWVTFALFPYQTEEMKENIKTQARSFYHIRKKSIKQN